MLLIFFVFCVLCFLDCQFVFCLSSSCVLCAQCCQCLWVVDLWLFCFVCLRPVTRVPNVASVSEFFILYYFALFVFVQVLVSNVNCQYPWVVNLWLICFVSLRSVSCVPTVVSVSGLPLRFSITCICFVQLNKQTPLSEWLFTYQNLCLYLEVPLMNCCLNCALHWTALRLRVGTPIYENRI